MILHITCKESESINMVFTIVLQFTDKRNRYVYTSVCDLGDISAFGPVFQPFTARLYVIYYIQ